MPLCHFLLTDSGFECDYLPSEETRRILISYLSEMTFADEDEFGLRLPKRNMPDGFQLSHMRCCERSLYGFMPGFTIVFSKEILRDIKAESSRVSVWNCKGLFLFETKPFFSLNILVTFYRGKNNYFKCCFYGHSLFFCNCYSVRRKLHVYMYFERKNNFFSCGEARASLLFCKTAQTWIQIS